MYLFAKALHVVGFVSWFAGLLYVVRLFVYDVEAAERPAAERDVLHGQLRLMQRRLWFGITWPAAVITFAGGFWMVGELIAGGAGLPGWLHAKLALLVALAGYHLQCGRIRRQLEAGACRWTSRHLRLFNEVGTLLLVAIVFVAVFRSSFAIVWGVLGLLGLAAALAGGALAYERVREASKG